MHFSKEQIEHCLGYSDCVESLRSMFAAKCTVPVRQHYTIELEEEADATMLVMPAWQSGEYMGVKLVNVFPGNASRDRATIVGVYILMDGKTGETLAVMDGGELTARRTACASALASDYLSRSDASKLLIVGSGRLAYQLGHAHNATRRLTEVKVWARNENKALRVSRYYQENGFHCSVAKDLEGGVQWADIVSSATMSEEPLIRGKWLRPGVHVDLIGSFKPGMRETDDEVIVKSRVFVDTKEGALAEAGDLIQPMNRGVFHEKDITAELGHLCQDIHSGRGDEGEITLFKSVGAALEDLAAAITCYGNRKKTSQ